jgi:hypothetical protein
MSSPGRGLVGSPRGNLIQKHGTELDKIPTYSRVKTHIYLQILDSLHLERFDQGDRSGVGGWVREVRKPMWPREPLRLLGVSWLRRLVQ